MIQRFITVEGVVQDGYKVASGQANDTPYPDGTIKMQKPLFKTLGLDLSSFYEGTLNISIAPLTFTVTNPEFNFFSVEWTKHHPPENFAFSKCNVVFNCITYSGWIYYPDPSTKKAHHQNQSIIEIIAPYISGIKNGDKVQLLFNPDEILLNKKS